MLPVKVVEERRRRRRLRFGLSPFLSYLEELLIRTTRSDGGGGGGRSRDGKDWLRRRRPVSPLLLCWNMVLPEMVLLMVSLVVRVKCAHEAWNVFVVAGKKTWKTKPTAILVRVRYCYGTGTCT